jgi:hypothetical protein
MNEERYRELQRNWRRRAWRHGLDEGGDDYHHDELVRMLERGLDLDEAAPLLYARFSKRVVRDIHQTNQRRKAEQAALDVRLKVARSAEDEAMEGAVYEAVLRIVAGILGRIKRPDLRAILERVYLQEMSFSEALADYGVRAEPRSREYQRYATAAHRALDRLPEDEREALDVWAKANDIPTTRGYPEGGSRLLVGLLTKDGLV